MHRRRLIFLAALTAVCAGVVIWQTHRKVDPQRKLTPELAKSALISLIESSEAGDLKDFPLDKWRSTAVVTEEDWTHWGPITLKLEERNYEFTITAGPEARLCKTWHRGTFEYRDDAWIALRPEVYQSALIDGRRTSVIEEQSSELNRRMFLD
jgi:hypothetical protein